MNEWIYGRARHRFPGATVTTNSNRIKESVIGDIMAIFHTEFRNTYLLFTFAYHGDRRK